MGIMCQILINRSREGFFRPGNQVTGVVRYALDEELECKAIIISLQGKGHCHWSESRGVGKNRQTTNYTGSEELCNIKTDVLPKEKQEDDTVKLGIGSYDQTFSFVLPENIPSSYKDYTGYIKYLIKVKFSRPGIFTFDKRFNTEILVRSYAKAILPLTTLIYGLEKSLFNLFGSNKKITLKAEIEKSFLLAGEKAELKFCVTNDTDIIIPGIEVELNSVTTYTSCSGKKKTKQDTIKESTSKLPSIPDASTANLSTSILTTPDLFTLQFSKVISIEYKLDVTVRLPMPHFNAKLELPIVICQADNTVVLNQNDVEQAEEAAAADADADAPPSYWEVMAEDEKKEEKS